MIVEPVRAFADNYIWIILDQDQHHCAIVDPGDHRPVIAWLEQHDVIPVAILITHHHGDHVGGVRELLKKYPGIDVYGPALENINGLTRKLGEGDEISVADTRLTVMDVPGHTRGHIAYYGDGALFCGDTLFAAGCGRVFDGTFEQLCSSLKKIRDLPDDTLVYCAHEYTVDNLGFAKWVEPTNPDIIIRDDDDMRRQEQGIPTVPSHLGLEKKTNPFLRYDDPEVVARVEEKAGHAMNTECAVFTFLRQWKDREYD